MTLLLPKFAQRFLDARGNLDTGYRRWMEDITDAVNSGTTTTATATPDPMDIRIGGSGWIGVTGNTTTGFTVTQRAGLTTDDVPEGATNLYFTDIRARAANEPASKTLAYDGSDRLSVVTDARGTKTMTYDGSDKLTAIAGTGEYASMTFTYSGDQLTAVTVT